MFYEMDPPPKQPLSMSIQTAICFLFLTFFDSFVAVVDSVTKAEIEQHLVMGMNMLAQGQYNDALLHLHAAVDADPNNYLSCYKRATVFLALNRPRPALADLNKVLLLKSDFTTARIKRGSVLLKLGKLDEAHIDLEKSLSALPDNEEATKLYNSIQPLSRRIQNVDQLMKYKQYEEAIEELKELIEIIPWDPVLREMRADCYIVMNNIIHAIADLRIATTKLRSDDTDGYLKLSQLYYSLGEPEQALAEIRECLKLDPDHPKCFSFYKKLKKVAKYYSASVEAQSEKRWDDCTSNARNILKHEPNDLNIRYLANEKLCSCLMHSSEMKKARNFCSQAINFKPEPHLYCDRADAYLAEDLIDEAQHDFRKALNMDENFGRAKKGLNKAQNRLKQASKRNYYKILGVSRTANKRAIAKAYRKLAQKWHPDNFQDEDEKKHAEKKFMDIAAAKEVLSNDDMRKKYDEGEDPLDPEAQQRGGNPFHGHPFGGQGGPFQFKFHFN